jgi:tetratricopeptide (TPR) repeat protein
MPIEAPYYAPKGVTAVCNYCGKTITAKSINGKLYINSLNGKIVIHKVLPRNKLNIATAYEEMGFLYRIMNCFTEAQEAFDQANFGINDLLKSDPDNLEYLRLKSLISFRKAEAYHAEGFKALAKKLYEDCVLIDQKTDASEQERKIVTELLLKLED